VIWKVVTGASGARFETPLAEARASDKRGRLEPDIAEHALLRSREQPPGTGSRKRVTVVDLFSGCGGLSLGIREAARAYQRDIEVLLAVDIEEPGLGVLAKNFSGAAVEQGDVARMFPGSPGSVLTVAERRVADAMGGVDWLLGGPPCQGHSDFNNRTRRNDDKNQLYLRMVRATEVLQPRHVLIENVPGAWNDSNQVVQRSMQGLRDLGYSVSHGVVDMSGIGVPQRRRRLVVVATRGTRSKAVDVSLLTESYGRAPRSLDWAIGDLVDASTHELVDAPARSVPATRKRIEYLFRHGLYDLPDSQRPHCHSKGGHTYSSIYGRLSWDEPAQTITTGFYCMCMGRYVHPERKRTLTAHEAARIQYFPDYFDFGTVDKRGQLATMIGNAVPMRLSEVIALDSLRADL
jgi:DNA (cytosine-5)-methyltransferase 1